MEDLFGGGGLVVPIIIGVIALALIVFTVAARYKIAKPDEAIIVTRRKSGETAQQKIVHGGGVFVVPFIQEAHSLSLASRQIQIQIDAISSSGINLQLKAVAIVKVDGNDEAIRSAAQRFLRQQGQIEEFTTEVLAGSLRSIVGTLSVEEIISDRAAFATRAADEAETSLTVQGLVLDTFQVQDISDSGDYLRNLGRPEQALLEERAEVAEAKSRQNAEHARIHAEQEILNSRREFDLRQAAIQSETDAAKAEADAAGPRSQAQYRQQVLEEEQKVAEREVKLREQKLNADVRAQADADRYRIEQEAEAKRRTDIANAEASAERVRLESEARANQVRIAAQADAESVKLAGDAEAANRRSIAEAIEDEGRARATATREEGLAEADAMDKKADAYRNYGEAAILDNFIKTLPDVVREGAAPMSNIKDLTVIDTEGASKVTKAGANNVAQGLETLKSLTGLDLSAILNNFAGGEDSAMSGSSGFGNADNENRETVQHGSVE